MRVGPPTPEGAPKGKPIEAPEPKPTNPWAIAAAIAAACLSVVLLLGGCAALVVVGVNAIEDEIDETAITKAQYDLIEPGTPESVVRARLGDPLSEESFKRGRLDCIYYAQQDEGLFSIDDFRFCFRDGVLVSKSFDSTGFD
jgi:outer membrane protein assembly factor BamE (lipoprotein component of BamABCDE complex)